MSLRLSLAGALFFILSHAVGQNPIQINGKFKPAVDNTVISVYKPVAGVFNMVLADSKSETTTANSSFKLALPVDEPGFIRLHGKGVPKTYFYAEPNGKVEITFEKDASGNIKVNYSGSNAEANNLLANNSPMGNQNFLQYRLPEIFQTESAALLVKSLQQEMATSIQPFTSMLKKNKITPQCYEAMTREIEQTMMHWVSTYLKNYFMTDQELPHVTRLSRAEVINLARILFSEYDPYDSKYDIATRTYNNQMVKSILIEDGVIGNKKEVTPVWAQFSKEFSMIISRLSAIDQATDTVQMKFMGMSLLSALVFKPMSDEDFLKVFSVYYTKFPGSRFNPIIIDQLSLDPKSNNDVPTKTANSVYVLNHSDTLSESEFKNIDQVKSIKELIKTHFKGTPVFIDFWATWCSPCIAEFQHEPALREFLEKKKIATLYVSIDSPNAIEKWKKAINRYQLAGYHYLVNQQVMDSIGKWFFGIPRYMIFDADGNLLNDNLLRPSSREELFLQINTLLAQ